jgi:hypothetical protein
MKSSRAMSVLRAASAALFVACTPALAQNPGAVTPHAFAVGKGPGTIGFTSILCGLGQIAIGQTAADPICRSLTGDVTINGSGVTAIGSSKVVNSMLLNPSTTVNGQTCTLGATCAVTATATNTLTFGSHLTSGGSSFNGSSPVTITSDATSANTPSTIVARDGSGNFSANTISAALSGNATTATTATTASDVANAPVIAKVLTGYVSGAGTVSASDSILSAIQKLNGNDALKLPLAGGTMSGAIAMGGNNITGGGSGSFTTLTGTGGSHTGLTGFGIRSSGTGAFDLTVANSENLTAGRTLTVTLNDAARTLNMGGNLTTAGAASLPSIAQGDVWYGSASGAISALGKSASATRYLSNTGTSNNPAWAQVDLSNGVTNNLPIANLAGGTGASSTTFLRGDNVWATPAGAGNVSGPGSATNLGIAKFNGTTGTIIMNSGVTIDASNNMAVPGVLAGSNNIQALGGTAWGAGSISGEPSARALNLGADTANSLTYLRSINAGTSWLEHRQAASTFSWWTDNATGTVASRMALSSGGGLSIRPVTGVVGFDLETPSATGTSIATSATVSRTYDGSAASPHTANTPSVSISRYDSITSAVLSGDAPALYIETIGNGAGAGNPNSNGVIANAKQNGKGDVVGVTGQATQNSATSGFTAFGGFFSGYATTVGSKAFAIETATGNSTGVDVPYTGLSPYPTFVGMHIGSTGANLSTAGVWISSAPSQWDVGIALTAGSVKTVGIQDDSASLTVLKATGTHTNGVDFSGAAMTTPFKSNAFTVDQNAIINGNGIGAGIAYGSLGTGVSSIGGTNAGEVVLAVQNYHGSVGDKGMLVAAGSSSSTDASTAMITFYTSALSAIVGSISRNGTGSVGYNTSSDVRGKPNRERLSLDYARSVVDRLEMYDFDKDGNEIRGIGGLAQQMYSVHKSLATPGRDPEDWWQAEKAGPVPFLVANTQQNNFRLDAIEARLSALEAR